MSATGGCLCGKIRYTLKAEPALTVVCHCTHCQKASGSAFSTNLVIQRADIDFTGDMASYDDTADSGNTLKRSFCPKCGASIMSESSGRPGSAVLKAGTLDDPSVVKPTMQIWTRSAQPWVKLEGEMKSMEMGR
ncbi:MAG TPA: GFA family protein [Beijerinckiaceae bacterium]|nr:GFA family protein [Methylobacteriaceae bacterium]MCC0002211.1 GFA family protein [Methylobacteriaceae bacterium]MCO5088758.1 GFA family protein [Methylobacteriaceae bacterium]HRY04070.1 GFA family protein [Beijerinckiaceae bacterium]